MADGYIQGKYLKVLILYGGKRIFEKPGSEYKIFWENKEFFRCSFDENGQHDIEDNFQKCGMGNNCLLLAHSRMYPCAKIPNIRHLNKYFHKNFEVIKTDSVDIYEVSSYTELAEKMALPVNFCRYCEVETRNVYMWAQSEKN